LEEFVSEEFITSIISNVTTKPYSSKDDAIELLCQQLISPVKYKQSIAATADNVDAYIEFGQGIVLKGLNRKITKTPTLNVSDLKSLEKTIRVLND